MRLLNKQFAWNLTKAISSAAANSNTHLRYHPASSAAIHHAKQNYSSKCEDKCGGDSEKSGPPKQKLLRMPAFPLQETMDRFLKSCEPLLDEEEMCETLDMANAFLECEGKELQELLEEAAKKEENWLGPRWQKAAYLQFRSPVTLFSNPAMVFPLADYRDTQGFLFYTAKMIYMMLKFKQIVDDGKLPVAKMGKLELDNSQFGIVFGTCRIPKPGEDEIQYNPKSKHIVVIYKNHFYKVNAYDSKGNILHPAALVVEMEKILKAEKFPGPPIGILSTIHRDKWAAAYEELLKDPCNAASVQAITEAIFTVSLDEEVPMERGVDDFEIRCNQLLHGGGVMYNSGNRWMDKTIQFIVNPNGISGYCYEHSPAEGQPVAVMCDYTITNLNKEELLEGSSISDYECSEKLNFVVSPELEKHIEDAKTELTMLIGDIDMRVLQFKGFGKEFCKTQKLSPDSFIQMALQLAFFKLHREPAAQYESAHQRIYYNGRTETIRSCSTESLDFAVAMVSKECSDKERADFLRKAVAAHREYTTLALQGRGCDRHLFGLKLMALENKRPVPELYKSPGFVKSTNFRMSTSQVASVHEAYMCYAPGVHDGYACCYSPRKNDIFLALAAFRTNPVTCVDRLYKAVEWSLNAMQDVLLKTQEKKSDDEKKPAKSKL